MAPNNLPENVRTAADIASELGRDPSESGTARLAAALAGTALVRRLHTDHGYTLVRDLFNDHEWFVHPMDLSNKVHGPMSMADALVTVELLAGNGGELKVPTLCRVETKALDFRADGSPADTLPIMGQRVDAPIAAMMKKHNCSAESARDLLAEHDIDAHGNDIEEPERFDTSAD